MNNTKDFKQYLKTSSTKTLKIMANMKEVKENNVKLTNSNRINKIKSDIYDIIKEEVDALSPIRKLVFRLSLEEYSIYLALTVTKTSWREHLIQ